MGILSDLRHSWSIIFLEFLMRIDIGMILEEMVLYFFLLFFIDLEVSDVSLLRSI
jgi:hypothetical protein